MKAKYISIFYFLFFISLSHYTNAESEFPPPSPSSSSSTMIADNQSSETETLFLDSLKEKAKEVGGKILDKGKELVGKAKDKGKELTGKALEVTKLIAENAPWSKIWTNLLKDSAKPALKGCLVGSTLAVPAAVAASTGGTPAAGLGVIGSACTISAIKAGAPGFAKTVYHGIEDTVKLTKLDKEIKENEGDVSKLEKIASDANSFVIENQGLDETTKSKITQASSDVLQNAAEAKQYINTLKKTYSEIKTPSK